MTLLHRRYSNVQYIIASLLQSSIRNSFISRVKKNISQGECNKHNVSEGELLKSHLAPYLPHHAVPHAVNLLPMLSIGDQIEVISEAHNLGQTLEDVNAKALAALFHRSHPFLVSPVSTEKTNKRER